MPARDDDLAQGRFDSPAGTGAPWNPVVFALRRPLTILVLVAAVVLGGGIAAARMAYDIFPDLNLPVIYVAQPYGGMDPAQMEGLLTNYYEYHFLYINNIHHVESRNIQGMALMKLVFHPGTNMAQAMAETIAYVNRSRAFMPPGTVSPFVTRFDVGGVPVGYLVLSSDTRGIGEIQDQALFKVRPMFAALPGVSAPPPFGGSQRTVVVRLDPERIRSYAMPPDEVISALEKGNVVSPSGVVRLGDSMPIVPVNSMIKNVDDFAAIPIRTGSPPNVYLRDVATVRDAADVPTGYALVDGRRAVYLLVTKRADASTLDVVANVRRALPEMQAVLPPDINVRFVLDQSPVVRSALRGLAVEAALGAGLIGLIVVLMLRDPRGAWIVVLNIPFALAGAAFGLWVCGQTVNLMTLGGLALAVGVLVDESTVELENIHARLESDPRLSIARAVRLGNQDTAVPRLLALLCILAVFLPSFFMTGSARALFTPLALAVGFAMTTSYLLSSTFVPVLAVWLLRRRPEQSIPARHRLLDWHQRQVTALVNGRSLVLPVYVMGALALAFAMLNLLEVEIFPAVDAGRLTLRLRAAPGTRIERTEELTKQVLATIEREVGPGVIETSVAYVGVIPSSYPINMIHQFTSGPEEAILRVAFRHGEAPRIGLLRDRLRQTLGREMPRLRIAFEPADIVSDVMSFGSSSPVEVAVSGPNFADTRAFAAKLERELAAESGLRDVRTVQALDYPTLAVEIDRERAGLSGVTPAEVARSLVAATSSSRFIVPNYWPDPKTGIGYQVQVELPYALVDDVGDLESLPVRPASSTHGGVLLRDLARINSTVTPGEYDRYNMKRMVSLVATPATRDLAGAARRVDQAIARAGALPTGAKVEVRGQLAPLREILQGLGVGLALAVLAIVMVLTAYYQSFRLAFVVFCSAPAVAAGVLLGLAATGTSINIQSYLGAIMASGVSVANAILLVTVAERYRRAGDSAAAAGVQASRTRLRPILMTALAMICGMLPLAIGLGEGGEASAALGRAVIGGLCGSTLATLFILPAVFAWVQDGAGRGSPSLDPDDPSSDWFDHPRPSGTAPAQPLILGVIALIMIGLGSGCSTGSSSRGPAASAIAKVSLAKPSRETITQRIALPGQIVAAETAPLNTRVSGYVLKVAVDIGDRLDAGQSLAQIDAPEISADRLRAQAEGKRLEAAVSQAKAALKLANANMEKVQAGLDVAKAARVRTAAEADRWRAEFSRVQQLVQERALTGSMLDETRSKLAAAEAAIAETDAHLKEAQAAISVNVAEIERGAADLDASRAALEVNTFDRMKADAMYEYLQIRAPFAGVVTRRLVDPGSLVISDTSNTPLFVMQRDDVVTVVADVPEREAARVRAGADVRISMMSGGSGETTLAAKLSRAAQSLDSTTRSRRVEVDLLNPDKLLLPGLFCTLQLALDSHEDVLSIPATAVVRDGEKSSCVVVLDGKAKRIPIVVGLTDGRRFEVVSGLDGEESVVATNPAALADGQSVEPEAPAQPAKAQSTPEPKPKS